MKTLVALAVALLLAVACGQWRWKVPYRLEPGNYELRKEWLPEAKPAPGRPVVTERAAFTVLDG